MRTKRTERRLAPARGAPREVAAVALSQPLGARSPRYPTYAELTRGALTAGALAALAATAGCQPPNCQPTRLRELDVHAERAVSSALDLEVFDAAKELGVSLGVVPHPAMALPGAMPIVAPVPAPPVSSAPPVSGTE